MACEQISNQSPRPVLFVALEHASYNRVLQPSQTDLVGAPVPQVSGFQDFVRAAIVLLSDVQRGEPAGAPRVLGFIWQRRGTIVASATGWSPSASPLIAPGYTGSFDLIITQDGRLAGVRVP